MLWMGLSINGINALAWFASTELFFFTKEQDKTYNLGFLEIKVKGRGQDNTLA